MKYPTIRFASAFFGLAFSAFVTPTHAQDEPGWKLIWSDEFNTPTIDMSKWTFQVGASDVNSELEYYSNSATNAFIDSGSLVIRANKENVGGRNYSSAKLYTQGKGDWLYGRVEVRAKLNNGQGMWPAIWMMPTTSAYGGWPASGEMDIMELLGNQPNKVYGTIHWAGADGGNAQSGSSYTLKTGTFADGYHVFAYEWDVDQQNWYIDSTLYFSTKQGQPFDKTFYLILNVAVGGSWPGNPDNTTPFPNDMSVDYARVYQKSTSNAIVSVGAPAAFTLSENPFRDETFINNGGVESAVTIRDLSGKILDQRRLSPQEKQAVGKDLPKGIYFLQAISGGRVSSSRLFKTQ